MAAAQRRYGLASDGQSDFTMARPKKTDTPDLALAHVLTIGLIERLNCPAGVAKVFLKDKEVTGLKVRVTAKGAKAFVYEAKLNGKAISKTIGAVNEISIKAAQDRARELMLLIKTQKIDPRALERQAQAAAAQELAIKEAAAQSAAAAAASKAICVGDLWSQYLAEGHPKRRPAWKPGYRASLELMAAPGGVPKRRGKGLTRQGPIYPLLALPLGEVTEDALQLWFEREAQAGKHQAARAFMMFRGFLRWCAGRPQYRHLIDRDAGKALAILESLPTHTRRTDAIEADQLPGWWQGVAQLPNRTASVYLMGLVLTGARKQELAGLTWENVDFRWRKLTMADKVHSTRTIPLGPYLAHLLATLPRVNEYVFASPRSVGRISDARASHNKALQSAAIQGLTIHGLRRTFSLLGEAAGAPAGAIAQVMGHSPSGTAEGYRPRSLDALRPYLEKIEAHILTLAGVQFDAKATPGALRIVGA